MEPLPHIISSQSSFCFAQIVKYFTVGTTQDAVLRYVSGITALLLICLQLYFTSMQTGLYLTP